MPRLFAFTCGLILLTAAGLGLAAPALPTTQVPPLTPESGNWLVCCASYTGPEAVDMANQCAMIIRSRDHLPAYVINYGEQERKKRTAEIEQELKLNPDARMPRRTTRIPDQCAVVVGGFATIDAARTALDKIKQLAAPEIKLSEG
jgi:hypothetical protein